MMSHSISSRRPRPVRHALAAAALAACLPAAASTWTWTSGTFVDGVTATNPLPVGDTLVVAAGGNKFFSGGSFVFTNHGTVSWGDTLYVQSGARLVNHGLWDATGDVAMHYNGGAATAFENRGTLRKSGGTGVATLSDGLGFVNHGAIEVVSGTLAFVGGSRFEAGSQFSGSGVVALTSGANTFAGAFHSAGNLELRNGWHMGDGAVVGGTVGWTGGYLTGGWTVADGQRLAARDGGHKYLQGEGMVLEVASGGTLAWDTGNALYVQSGARLVNRGLIDVSTSSAFHYNGGAATQVLNEAGGTLRVAAGHTLNVGAGLGFTNAGGTLQAQGTLVYLGGALFQEGSHFSGSGVNVASGNNSFQGRFESGNLELRSGVHQGEGAVVGGTAAWTGGYLTGTWAVADGQRLAGRDGGNKFVQGEGTVLEVAAGGTLAWDTSNALYLQSGARLVNRGLVDVSSSSALLYNGGAATQFLNEAGGTLRVAAGQTLAVGNGLGFTNAGGTLQAEGTVLYQGGALFQAGSRFNGGGVNAASGNNSFQGRFESGNLELRAGTHAGEGAVVGGTAAWTGGYVTGTWTVADGQRLAGRDGGNKFVQGEATVLEVAPGGTLAWETGNALYLQSGARLINRGRLDLQADGGLYYNGGAAVALINEGLLVKSGGAGTAVLGNNLGLQNLGTIAVRSGTLALPTNFANEGALTGSGALSLAGTLNNAGIVAPGDDGPGTLALSGSFAQGASGSLSIELESLSSHDLFTVSGSVSLGGTLALSCHGACFFEVGDEVVVLDYAGARGGSTFAGLTLSGFASGGFETIYDDFNTRVLLRVTEAVTPVPEPRSLALLLAGLGVVGALARRRRQQS